MTVVSAGFVDFEISWRKDVFDGAPQETSAASFGTLGINFSARKATSIDEWLEVMNGYSCPMPEIKPVSRFGADAFYDAGDQGCAYGPIVEIAGLLNELEMGQTLEVRATDPTVEVDLPAWVRIKKYALIRREDDRYLIQKQ